MMNIVILDYCVLLPEHVRRLKRIGQIYIYNDFPKGEEVIKRLSKADVVVTASTDINEEILAQCGSLKMICLASTGYDRIDVKAANKRGIIVTNVVGYATTAVAEHTFALLFALKHPHEHLSKLVGH